jgi:hypothetical protein
MNVAQLVRVGRIYPGKINKLVTSDRAHSSLSGPDPRIVHLSAAAQMVCKLAALIYE